MDPDDHRIAPLVARLRAAGCVFAEEEAALILTAAGSPAELERLTSERVGGVPLEHVLGWADFAGIRVPVDRGVFVPRPRTEFLVECAVERMRPGVVLVDLCCGSGAIAAAIASRVPAEVFATDIDPRASDNARRTLGAWRATVITGDLFAGLPQQIRGAVGAITLVAPYVPTDEIGMLPREARDFEPLTALDGGPDGLEVVRRAASEAPQWLARGGFFLTEVAEHQSEAAVLTLEGAGLTASILTDGDSVVVLGLNP